ncbi:MAG: hypothetical protein IKO45_05005 [Clostridia bacterium]|nr:hypothetical protein [Clostridia bacterium]MBR4623893.1 hypothetical protein [Clostridia bacterium]
MSWYRKLEWVIRYLEFIWDYDFEEDYIPDIIRNLWDGNVDDDIAFLEERYETDAPGYAKAQEYIRLFKEIKEY